jgi:hypothetical protein
MVHSGVGFGWRRRSGRVQGIGPRIANAPVESPQGEVEIQISALPYCSRSASCGGTTFGGELFD